MRIRRIEKANFCKSERTLFEEFTKKNQTFVRSLGPEGVVVFLSLTGNQMLFVHGFHRIDEGYPHAVQVLMSIKYRIVGGTWNPMRLANYAKEAGLKIEGLKLFEEHYQHLLEKTERKKAA